jgi:hypothetical protein
MGSNLYRLVAAGGLSALLSGCMLCDRYCDRQRERCHQQYCPPGCTPAHYPPHCYPQPVSQYPQPVNQASYPQPASPAAYPYCP